MTLVRVCIAEEHMEAHMRDLVRRRPVLVTAIIDFQLPDHPLLIQEYIRQEYDFHPYYPELRSFLRFWDATMQGKRQLVRFVAQSLDDARFRHVDSIHTLN